MDQALGHVFEVEKKKQKKTIKKSNARWELEEKSESRLKEEA